MPRPKKQPAPPSNRPGLHESYKRSMDVAWVPIGSLKPHPKNSRKHDDKQVQQLGSSLDEFGVMRPILVDETDTILAGHGLWMAAQAKGLAEVPIIRHSHLTDVQKRAYIIADNKLAMLSAWDDAILRAELGDLKTIGFDLKVVGFGDLEVVRFMNQGPDGARPDEDQVPGQRSETTTRAGDVWICGAHRICCGSSTESADVRRLLAGAKPNLMVTDPPYGVNYQPNWRHRVGAHINKSGRTGAVLNDDRPDWREAWNLFPGDIAYIWHGAVHARVVAESIEACGFAIRSQIIWAKESLVMGRGDYHWQHEPCWYAVRNKGHWCGDRKQSTLWTISRRGQDQDTIHGTQKPVEAMRRPIINNSAKGEQVYEPFLGSGTTVIAAETTGRACLAMELSPAYVDVAVRRWQAFTGRNAVLEATGLEFDRVAEARATEAKPKPRKRAARAAQAAPQGHDAP